jgi:hypothetical protein
LTHSLARSTKTSLWKENLKNVSQKKFKKRKSSLCTLRVYQAWLRRSLYFSFFLFYLFEHVKGLPGVALGKDRGA